VDGALAEPVGGIVALVRFPDGQTVLASHGYAETDQPIDVGDSFRVASITKTYMATLVLSLQEDHLLAVDDPVATHLPDLGVDQRITIKQLLTHSSGLADHWASSQLTMENCAPCTFTTDDLVALIDVAHPMFEPGSHWSYSNTGYVMLRMIVEAVTGNDLASELRTRVLEPAQVTQSYLIGLEPALAEPVAGHWRVDDKTAVEYPWSYDDLMTRADAAGSLVATAPDVLRFLDALFDGRIISEASLSEMLETVPRTPDGGDQFVRFGFGIHHPMDGDWWMHGGGIPGFHSVYLRDPETAATVIVLTNCSGCLTADATEQDVIQLGTRLMNVALGDPSDP
jgi:D-alanyl-D-alanine carboxypeptidase